MPQGSHWKIYIPSHKAYGKTGSKGLYDNFSVPPYSSLIFDIELVDVVNP
jgi:FKBP-type peptidyl-prolyl cis-trans isomerase